VGLAYNARWPSCPRTFLPPAGGKDRQRSEAQAQEAMMYAHQQVFSTGEWWDIEEYEPGKYRRMYYMSADKSNSIDMHYFHALENGSDVCAKCDLGRHQDARPTVYRGDGGDDRVFAQAAYPMSAGTIGQIGRLQPGIIKPLRTFDTGATRDTDDGKLDYEGFLSPLALTRFAEYMHEHRFQADGSLRASDNWQKGIPLDAYIKSAWRHFVDWWMVHRNVVADDDLVEDALCALIFNAQGYLHELLKARK
jgi:hypothetical protein